MASASKFKLIFPEHREKDFRDRLSALPEYQLYQKNPLKPITSKEDFEEYVQAACSGFEKTLYQHFVQHYLSRRSPYKSLLLFHGLGSGKSCSAITIAESLLLDHSQNEEPRILLISPAALQASFEDQIFSYSKYLEYGDEILRNQCTDDTYRKLVYGTTDRTEINKRLRKIIHARYQFITYEGLVTFMKNRNGEPVRDKVIIIDEAHNLRQNEGAVEKAAAEALVKLVETGERNRIVLLSATPMYNEPNEIFWLLSLLIKNDKRTDVLQTKTLQSLKLYKINSVQDEKAFELLKILSGEYISYIKGTNPFTFPVRLSPSVNNISILTSDWVKEIQDGLVPTPLGENQKGIIHESIVAGKDVKNSPVLLQLTNITYPSNSHGEDGFKKIFRRLESDYLQIEYIPGKENTLLPTPDKLGKIASKIQRICDLIRSSDGIVVIYSQFVWSGVIPCAIALEHMGFQRYISQSTTQSLLRQSKSSAVNVKYTGQKNPSYCILSGDTDVMGNSKIFDILGKVNSKENINGQKIKVVLMTPIAAEGLNFKNVREIHVLDPWYHMNRLEQVIGRTIRTCSHSSLPLENRNVTVFLHVTTNGATNDTADTHAYKISARKLFEMKKAEKVIRDSALDCSLMLHTNYYPKDIFQFPLTLQTSQHKSITYAYGDSIENKPQCTITKLPTNDTFMRSEMYENILPSLISKVKTLIQKQHKEGIVYISLDDLITHLQVNKNIALTVIQNILYPAIILPQLRIYPHTNGIIIESAIQNVTRTEIKLPSAVEIQQPVEKRCDIDVLLNGIQAQKWSSFREIVHLYTSIDSLCWSELAKRCIETRSPVIDKFAGYLAETGALITQEELPKVPSQSKYIGYIDIFNTTTFQGTIYNPRTKTYRDPTDVEIKQIKANRVEFKKPSQGVYGVLMPRKNKKDMNEPARNEFKIITPGVGKGAECSAKKWNEINDLLKIFNIVLSKTEPVTKSQVCFTLGMEMFRKGVVLLYPEWKPKPKST